MLSAPNSPKWWFRYVDDSHVCTKREHVNEFHSHLNSINTNIKFTIEIEPEGSIAFLDTKTTRQDDGSITVSVYRKATHTDRYLDFKSHHPPQHKYSVVRTLMDPNSFKSLFSIACNDSPVIFSSTCINLINIEKRNISMYLHASKCHAKEFALHIHSTQSCATKTEALSKTLKMVQRNALF